MLSLLLAGTEKSRPPSWYVSKDGNGSRGTTLVGADMRALSAQADLLLATGLIRLSDIGGPRLPYSGAGPFRSLLVE